MPNERSEILISCDSREKESVIPSVNLERVDSEINSSHC